MRHVARTVILLVVLCVAAVGQQPKWQGSFAASIGSGGVTAFTGTWTAVPGETPETVSGTWSLRDPSGAEVARGTWAAVKEGKVWKGTWQARRSSGQVYDGAWRSQIELPPTSQFPELFETALAKAVSGTWSMGSYAGAWTIRAYAPK
jgi:hypothetical protein